MEGNSLRKLRVFLALPLPEFTGILSSQLEILCPHFPSARWTQPKDFHITLHFFGSIHSEKLPLISLITRESAARCVPFEISLGGFGVFPDKKNPSVVWAGIAKGRAPLAELQVSMKTRLEALGLDTEKRPFVPHITLGRLASEKEFFPELPEFPETPQVYLREAALYQSILDPKGSRYDVLEKFSFSK